MSSSKKRSSYHHIGSKGPDCEDEDNEEAKKASESELDEAAAVQKLLLARMNASVEGAQPCQDLPEGIWMEWLWHSDPLQECHMEVMLNRMHLLGLLIARYRASRQRHLGSSNASLAQILACQQQRLLWLFEGPVSRYTLRQLADTLQNLLLQWNRHSVMDAVPAERIRGAVDALFHRFGTLASGTGHANAQNSAFDDPASIEKCPDDDKRVMLNRICIRRLLNCFLVLYRHMHCWEAKEQPEDVAETDCGIKLHHILAASDDFSRLSMHWDLMPAARLNYVHDFRGLFNCISQVVYFHNPQYERRKQERKDVDAVSKGSGQIEMIQLLPCYMQLHPDILVEHEDTCIFAPSHHEKQKWAWLIMGRKIYLCSPWDEGEQARQIFFHPNAAVLLHLFREKTGFTQ